MQKEAERVAAADPNPRREERLALALRDDGTAPLEDHGADGAAAADLREVCADVTHAVESIQTREKALSTRFQATISEYAARAASLEQIEKQYQEPTAIVGKLQNELNKGVGKLAKTKDHLLDKRHSASDNSPLTKIRSAIVQLKAEVKRLELQSAILQRSLTQTWLEERDLEVE
jgi:estrogen-related receptor beta like 1